MGHTALTLYGPKMEGLSCFLSSDIEKYNSSDMVIFKANVFREHLIFYRPPGKLWEFYGSESSLHSPGIKKKYNKKTLAGQFVFNYTINYSATADLHYPYGRCSARDAEQDQAATEIDQRIKQKFRLLSWMVSNCKTSGLRENYFRELSKYVDIDVYGCCGNMECTSNK